MSGKASSHPRGRSPGRSLGRSRRKATGDDAPPAVTGFALRGQSPPRAISPWRRAVAPAMLAMLGDVPPLGPVAATDLLDADAARSYDKRHGLHATFETLATDVMNARPADPLGFLLGRTIGLLEEREKAKRAAAMAKDAAVAGRRGTSPRATATETKRPTTAGGYHKAGKQHAGASVAVVARDPTAAATTDGDDGAAAVNNTKNDHLVALVGGTVVATPIHASKVSKVENKTAAAQYGATHGIHAIFNALATDVLNARPEDPLVFLAGRLLGVVVEARTGAQPDAVPPAAPEPEPEPAAPPPLDPAAAALLATAECQVEEGEARVTVTLEWAVTFPHLTPPPPP